MTPGARLAACLAFHDGQISAYDFFSLVHSWHGAWAKAQVDTVLFSGVFKAIVLLCGGA